MRRIYKFNAKIYWLAPLDQAPISELHFTSFQSKYPVLITVCFQFEVVSASFQKTSREKKADEVDLFTMHIKSLCQSLFEKPVLSTQLTSYKYRVLPTIYVVWRRVSFVSENAWSSLHWAGCDLSTILHLLLKLIKHLLESSEEKAVQFTMQG